MAKPRIFISSTYYDLKYVRASLELFVESLGYEPILSEKGDIAYTPDRPLDESCYREARNSDIYVLIIGGRYGSEASRSKGEQRKASDERYDSITRSEYKSAANENIPIYILIEKAVYTEYQTYLGNKENTSIKYVHVNSVNVFQFIEEVLGQRQNNPVFTFEKHSEIESWLREQWAGYFREMLKNVAKQPQLKSMSAQISELSEVNKTLRTYLEQLLSTVGQPKESRKLISSEHRRLEQAQTLNRLSENPLIEYLHTRYGIPISALQRELRASTKLEEFVARVSLLVPPVAETREEILSLSSAEPAFGDFSRARSVLGLRTPRQVENDSKEHSAAQTPEAKRKRKEDTEL
jgi:hypothetical protein